MATLAEVIEEMFLSYVRTENYVNLSEEARNEFCDRIEELKTLVDKN